LKEEKSEAHRRALQKNIKNQAMLFHSILVAAFRRSHHQVFSQLLIFDGAA
jgi:hypothetical protein